jgi:uncharacterized protein (DUF58 family)
MSLSSIPSRVTEELRYIELYTARRMRNQRAGAYTSRLRGSGFDFDEHRPYRPGDDVRRIDWNVTARLRQPFIRLTHAERELNVVVALDVSASMGFGTRRLDKKELMTYIAACFAFSAAADQINLGLLAFTDRVVGYWPPKRSRARVWKALDELWTMDLRAGESAVLPVATFLQRSLKRASLVFIVSDFLSVACLEGDGALRLLTSMHDVVAIVVEDPAEARLFSGHGVVDVRDPDSGIRRRIALGNRARRAFAALVGNRRTALTARFRDLRMDHAFVQDDGPIVEPLLELFSARRHA